MSAPARAIGPARGRELPAGGRFDFLRTADGVRLRWALWPTPGATRTAVLLTGRTEFIEKHAETVADLIDRSFQVAVLDWRGQGGSDRPLADRWAGHVDDFAAYALDLDAFLDAVDAVAPPRAVALAHSMGGTVALAAAAAGRPPAARLALCAPMLGLRVGPLTDPAASIVASAMTAAGQGRRIIPGSSLHDLRTMGFPGNPLTRDEVRFHHQHAWLDRHPELGLGPPTWGWLAAACRAMADLRRPGVPEAATLPVLIAVAGDDPVVDASAAWRIAARLPDVRVLELPGARHEILMEIDAVRDRFWQALDALMAS